jgi:hypothetical protein
LEDPVDIYGHTHKFFKADKKTDGYTASVEVGERRIRDGVEELDQRVYGGQKVSRKDLFKGLPADIDSDDIEDLEDEDEDEEVEGEDDDDEEGVESDIEEEDDGEDLSEGDDEEMEGEG